MILYVNGDSHSAGAEAVNPHAFANDDPLYWGLGRQPHPDNLRASYGCELANLMGAILECDAESAASNDRIFRTTHDYLSQAWVDNNNPDYVVIGWSTWEREEWVLNDSDTFYQVTASGTDQVPPELKQKYKEWVIEQSDHNVINHKIHNTHSRIWALHNGLQQREIPHVFFNTYSDFADIKNLGYLGAEEYDWDGCYIDPYNGSGTYYNWCLARGFKTVNPNSYHFGVDAHVAWSEYLYQTIVQKTLTN
jgi:hypothetical protein